MLIGNVFDFKGREIRLAGLGTQAGEFGHIDADGVIAFRVRIVEGVEFFTGLAGHRSSLKNR